MLLALTLAKIGTLREVVAEGVECGTADAGLGGHVRGNAGQP